MAIQFRYTSQALRDLKEWKKHGNAELLRIKQIQEQIEKDPFATQGKYRPEALRYELSGCYSREVTTKDRFVYRPHPEQPGLVDVLACKGHHDDH
jgi:toxin YoeB